MGLVIDEGSRQLRQFVCPCCDTHAERTWANICDGDTALAVYYASCYHHRGGHEAWIDAILGTWGVYGTPGGVGGKPRSGVGGKPRSGAARAPRAATSRPSN